MNRAGLRLLETQELHEPQRSLGLWVRGFGGEGFVVDDGAAGCGGGN